MNDEIREAKETRETDKKTDNATRDESERRLAATKDFDGAKETHGESRKKEGTTATDVRGPITEETKTRLQEQRFAHASDAATTDKLQTGEREKKSEILEDMVARDFPVSSERRLDNSRDFHFSDDQGFEQALKSRDPSTSEGDARRTQGFYDSRDDQAFVRESNNTIVDGLHEKLHQKSMNDLPGRLDEGITEYFARQEAGPVGDLKDIDGRGREILKTPSDYEKEVEIVRKLEATIGRDSIEKAYFEGKSDLLKESVDRTLGEGSFQTIADALELGNYEAASAVIEQNKRR